MRIILFGALTLVGVALTASADAEYAAANAVARPGGGHSVASAAFSALSGAMSSGSRELRGLVARAMGISTPSAIPGKAARHGAHNAEGLGGRSDGARATSSGAVTPAAISFGFGVAGGDGSSIMQGDREPVERIETFGPEHVESRHPAPAPTHTPGAIGRTSWPAVPKGRFGSSQATPLRTMGDAARDIPASAATVRAEPAGVSTASRRIDPTTDIPGPGAALLFAIASITLMRKMGQPR